jgi:hypothetical protein
MYEAATGRMDRLEKSALVIWNKHSHLAITQKEDYEDWLIVYGKDRDLKTSERRVSGFMCIARIASLCTYGTS